MVDASNFCVILNNLSTRDYYVAAGDVIAELKLGKENCLQYNIFKLNDFLIIKAHNLIDNI